ncbi:MAG: response regulator transcription factor [Pseudomonadota bacterium]
MTDRPRLLVVEDEAPIREGLTDLLTHHGFAVTAVGDGQEGLCEARRGAYDLVLLDVMLPSLDGFAVCEALRRDEPDQPVIMLTARTADEDIIQGLKLGADDYVAKPFSVEQLVLRVKAVLRRAAPKVGTEQLELAPSCHVDLANLTVRRGAEEIPLTRREADVLRYLAGFQERPVPREELLHRVWGYGPELAIETRTVDIHIARIRRKIEADPAHPELLITVRGAGYRLLPAP